MKIKIDKVKEYTIEEFAEQHDLTMVVKERSGIYFKSEDPTTRFYAYLDHTEEKNGAFFCSNSGNGQTPEDAIANYAKTLSFKTLVVNAMCEDRREITVPRIIW